MREFETPSLAGSVLLAHPSLRDPNFTNSVVFLSMHDSENGAFGMVLNRPSGRRLNELMPDRDLGILAMAPVYLGGPVGQDQILLAAFQWDDASEVWQWRHDLTLESAPEILDAEGTVLRVFAGYSGWSKGQLERELQQNTWVVHSPDDSLLRPDTEEEDVWLSLVRSHGPLLRFLTDLPDNLGLN